MACAICPQGCGTVWIATIGVDNALTWTRLVHMDSWNLTPNRTEATKKRTSDTGGAAVKFCSDIIDWTCTIVNTLCVEDWLYADILVNQRNPSAGKTTWFFLGWDCVHAPAPLGTGTDPSLADADTIIGNESTYTTSDGGIYLYGTVSPPGFGIDNTNSDPATGEWNIDIISGPYFPAASGAEFSGSDEIPGNDT